tara:strand:+ start:3232 stop:3711 length:480 start_codon:yes stop_codon:yes gene_type:complete
MKKHILIVGNCGSGKTWVMKEIIKNTGIRTNCKFNLIRFLLKDKLCLLGKYVGDTFDGSDKLSMAVSKDFVKFKKFVDEKDLTVICEGDRFTNKNFIQTFNPYIIKIKDDGKKGRIKRNSKQTEQHLKRISTRIKNVKEDILLDNSTSVLSLILNRINK